MAHETIQIHRDELYERVWSEPVTAVAARLGLSDVGLAKICKKLNVPRPGRGYWEKKKHGRATPRPPLPLLKDGQEPTATVAKQEKLPVDTEQVSVIETMIAFETRTVNRIVVPERLDSPHVLVTQTQKSLKGLKPNDRGLLNPQRKGCLDLRVAPPSASRALRIMDALLKALAQRKLLVSTGVGKHSATTVSVLGETLVVSIEENIKQKEHQVTPAEERKQQRDRYFFLSVPRYDFIPTGVLSLRIKNTWSNGLRTTWSDGKVQRVENCLNAFVIGLIKAAVQSRAHRLERQRWEQEWQERMRQREEAERRQREEKEQFEKLLTDAENWQRSQLIRAYVDAVRASATTRHGSAPSELDQWLAWATERAERINPLWEGPQSLPGQKE
jgi:hypothetical protein